jgi:hypothetical protein
MNSYSAWNFHGIVARALKAPVTSARAPDSPALKLNNHTGIYDDLEHVSH